MMSTYAAYLIVIIIYAWKFQLLAYIVYTYVLNVYNHKYI